MNTFFTGFEKQALSYDDYRSKLMDIRKEEEGLADSEPIGRGPAMGIAGLGGAGLGGLMGHGSKKSKALMTGIGALLGGAGGVGLGELWHRQSKRDVADAKVVKGLPEDEKMEYFRHLLAEQLRKEDKKHNDIHYYRDRADHK